jgi:hypothetical protein
MPRWGFMCALSGVFVLLSVAVLGGGPFLLKHRTYAASVPQPPSLYTIELVKIRARDRACVANVVMDTHSERLLFQVATFGREGAPLTIDIAGGAYHDARRITGGYPDNSALLTDVKPPTRDVVARVCIANVGRRPVALFASTASEASAANTLVAGHSVSTNPVLVFLEARPTTLASRVPTILHRMTVFRPPFIAAWMLWILAVLVGLGVPILVLTVYCRVVPE